MKKYFQKKIFPPSLSSFVLTSVFVLFFNQSFFAHLRFAYPLENYFFFHFSWFFLQFFSLYHLFLLLLSIPFGKIILTFLYVPSILSSYASNHFGLPVDYGMIQNIIHTNFREASDQIQMGLFLIFFFHSALYTWIILRTKKPVITKKTVLLTTLSFTLLLVINFSLFYSQSKTLSSFIREHKGIRYFLNPTGWAYGLSKTIHEKYFTKEYPYQTLGEDAVTVHPEKHHEREIVIFVLGETVRGDHLSLNGYKKTTFPLLEKEEVYSYKNFQSCGTSTEVSVPCMFSNLTRDKYNPSQAYQTDNILDVLSHTKNVEVLWRDNNSDSKHVATRMKYEDYKTNSTNPICSEEECRDLGMLRGLEEWIRKQPKKDLFIVLHQMGNHGPAYYKRYPENFSYFKPECKTSELDQCSLNEIQNSYDNALRYTDYFLYQTIQLLKKFPYDETSMIYMSDHGESLGENGVFLHGMPYSLAPIAQKHVAAVFWFGGTFEKEIRKAYLTSTLSREASHDSLFHTILGLFEVNTKIYKPELDLLKDSIQEP